MARKKAAEAKPATAKDAAPVEPTTTRSTRSRTKAALAAAAAEKQDEKATKATRSTTTKTKVKPAPKAKAATPKAKAAALKANTAKAKKDPTSATTKTKGKAKPATKGSTAKGSASTKTRTPPTESTSEVEPEELSKPATRKRGIQEVEPEPEVSETRKSKKTKAEVPTAPAPPAINKRKGTAKWTYEDWFEEYADPEDPETMTPAMSHKWLDDLGLSGEGAAYFVIAWKLRATAMFTLSKKEFLQLKKLGIKTNEQLLKQLPAWIKDVAPSQDNSAFKDFYKFCFNYGKSGGAAGVRTVDMDVAVEFLKMALEKKRFDINYKPSEEEDGEGKGGVEAQGSFPHLNAFVEFMQKIRPVKVINKDQWDSFLPFNQTVGWDLKGYSEDGAWPSLFDQYVQWRKETYPETVAKVKEGESDKEEGIDDVKSVLVVRG